MELYFGDLRDKSNYLSTAFLDINSCGIQTEGSQDVKVIRRNGRLDFLLIYVKYGHMDLLANGNRFFLNDGDAFIYFPNMCQEYTYYADRPMKTYWVHFSGSCVDEIIKRLNLNNNVVYNCGIHTMPHCFEKMIDTNLGIDVAEKTVAIAALLEILCTLKIHAPDTSASMGKTNLKAAIRHINLNYFDDCSQSKLATICNMSQSRFCHLFKETYKISPHQFVLEFRIKKAENFLLSTDMSISEISSLAGFNDPLYFSRVFKKKKSCTPTEFKKYQT